MTRALRICCVDILALAILAALPALPASAQSLSQKIARQISEAQKAEAGRQYDRALAIYARTIGMDAGAGGDRRDVLRRRAALYEQLEEFAKAEADLTAALAVEPTDASLHAARGYFYFRRNRHADALADFVAGARAEPGRAVFPFAAGRIEAALGRHGRAIELYTDAMRLDPRDARPLLARAETQVHLGRHESAKADYTRALALGFARTSDRFFAWIGRGNVHLALGDFDAAVEDFDKALAIDPAAFNALAWRAYAQEKRGRRDLALADYERAFLHAPDDNWVMAGLRRLRAQEPTPGAANPSARP